MRIRASAATKPNAPEAQMKRQSPAPSLAPMNADAYAGFLKLWLTPAAKTPPQSADVAAYLRYANEREPVRFRAGGSPEKPSRRAA